MCCAEYDGVPPLASATEVGADGIGMVRGTDGEVARGALRVPEWGGDIGEEKMGLVFMDLGDG